MLQTESRQETELHLETKDRVEYVDQALVIDHQNVVAFSGHLNTDISDKTIADLTKYCYSLRDSLYSPCAQIEVVADGLFREMGIEGKALLLKFNEWSYGEDTDKIGEIIEKL